MLVRTGYWRGVLGCKVFQSHLYPGNHISNTIQRQDCPRNSTEKTPPNLSMDAAAMGPTRKKVTADRLFIWEKFGWRKRGAWWWKDTSRNSKLGDKIQNQVQNKGGQAFLSVGVWTPTDGDEADLWIQVCNDAGGTPIGQPAGRLGVSEWKKEG